MEGGYLYILTNPVMPGLVKIGMTTRSIEEKNKELSSSSGVPLPFEVGLLCAVKNCKYTELEIHQYLDTHRASPKREFFKISLSEAIKLVNKFISNRELITEVKIPENWN